MSSPTESPNPDLEQDEDVSSGTRDPRKTALVLGGTAFGLLVVAVVAVMLLGGQADDPVDTGAPLGQRRAATGTASGTQSATGSAGQASQASDPVRNPFSAEALSSNESSASVSVPPTAAPSVPTGAPASPTVTAVPTNVEAIYLGLYGFTKKTPPQAMFRVNTEAFTVDAGKPFGTGFTYLKRTAEGCAQVKYGISTQTLCAGDVVQVR